jgi:PAS domain-containing protein
VRATVARVLVIASFVLPVPLGAQSNVVRPALDWMTVRTRFFDVHYPSSMTVWALDLTTRIDAVHDAVSAFVGYSPRHRITLILEDPISQSNGFANAPLADPLIVLWPTPPDPSGMLGMYRDWPELLVVHEYAHIAHLERPTRNPRERRFWRLLPLRLGPIALRTPRWAVEGYATYVEGRLTGSGRPHGAARAAYLRQWALEGKLPTYAQLSSGGEFAAGAMAYLVGSAYLEWLVAQRGDSSLVAMWRRLSARQPRTFALAFAGVYGAPPDELYGQFTVELTRRALAVRDTLAVAGLDTGVLVQRRRWGTGDPAVSADGRRLAVELQSRLVPGPLVVWRTEERVDTTRERRARERLLALDPQDVPAISGEPRPKAPVAILRPSGGRPFHSPRFFQDSSRLLVAHDDPLGDGAYRSDLYEWNYRSGALRRITRGASIHDADPLPDGRSAVAVRCENGLCDLVRVDLGTGAVTVLQRATPSAPFYRPRVAPDGASAVVAVQRDGRWRLAQVPVDPEIADGDSQLTFVDPDDGANRYDAAFLPGGRAVVCVSDAGGVPNLETIDLDTRATRPLTRVTNAVFAPAPNPADGSLFFLSLHARGVDVRRVSLTNSVGRIVDLPPALAPAVPTPVEKVDTFPRAAPARPRAYGAGPHQHRLLPGGSYSAEGGFATLSLMGVDPVGRFAYALNGALGERSTWRGASVTASWRGSGAIGPGLMTIDGTLFHAEQRPSEQRTYGKPGPRFGTLLDATFDGATMTTATTRDYGLATLRLRIGATLGTVNLTNTVDAVRGLAFGEARGVVRMRRAGYRADVAANVHASRGGTDGLSWARAIGSLTADVATPFGGGRIDATLGGSDGGGGVFERFAIGGGPTPLVDAPALAQRIAMPALPVGFAMGTHFTTLRASTALGRVRPFYWIGTTRENLTDWARVVGLDVDYAVAAFPAFAVPAISIRAGAAYSWDDPFRHRVGVYVGVAYRP